MTKVIGVRFRTAGKIYFFDPLDLEIKRGDHVIVETARGIEFGTVMTGTTEVEDEKVVQPLKPVLRIANQRDIDQEAANKLKEKEAFKICLEKIRKHELEMKLIDAEYTFDNNKVLFYFTADGRIDFRELVKDLAGVFKTRIELRQIGVRDETKIVGGIGICGRPLCCHTYLADFIPVSIKMAKEQNLSLNPTKISGVCGRLMCCLKNEEDTYEELNRKLPGIGDYVTTDDGLKGEVHSVNVLRQLVKVVVEEGDEKEIKEYPVERLQFRRRHGKKDKQELSKEEMQELERLEGIEKSEESTEERPTRRQGENKPGREERWSREGQSGREERWSREGQSGREGQPGAENQQGAGRPDGRNRQNGGRRQGERGAEGQSGGRNRPDGRNRRGEGRPEDNRQTGSRQNGNRQDNNRQGMNRADDNRQDNNRRGMNRADDNRQDNSRQGMSRTDDNRQDNNRQGMGRPDNNRQGENRDGQYQGGRNRHGRYRNNARTRQEGQSRQHDNQSEGE